MKNVFKLIVFLPLLVACEQKATSLPLNKELATMEETPITSTTSSNKILTEGSIPKPIPLSSFFSVSEINALQTIKKNFEKGITNEKFDRPLSYYYESHAQRLRLDLFNKFPLTLNFPYNGDFSLSEVAAQVKELSFLTQKCGFQKEDKTIQHYYCFKQSSNFMDFQKALSNENSFIDFLLKDYQSNKSLSTKVKEGILLTGDESFNFEIEEHQLVYLFYHLLINEERMALEKVNELEK